LNWIDFRSDVDYDDSFQRLIWRIRGLTPKRGTKRKPLVPQVLPTRGQRRPHKPRALLLSQRFRIRGLAPGHGRRLVGREPDLKAIKRKLLQALKDESGGIVVIRGVGGIGKSALLNHLARDATLAALFPDDGLWVGVGESPDLSQLLRTWGQAVKLPGDQLLRINDIVAASRANLQDRRMLLLVDDVWLDHHAECFRVAGAGSVVLYSTRVSDLADRLAPSSKFVYHLRGLKPKKGVDLLADVAPDAVRKHRRMCEELVSDVDGLPLAILVAGKMLNREIAAGTRILFSQ
jgi:hypothetical protein